MPKRVKLSDIATRCGVSTVTVSKALSGQRGVGQELRKKIIAMADEMGYVKNPPKEDAAPHKTCTIGVVVAERFLTENQSFYWTIYQEISMATVARNAFAILEVVSSSAELGMHLPKVLSEKRIEGLVILGQFRKSYLDYLMSRCSLPYLFLDNLSGVERADCVVSNNVMGGKTMTDYLFSLGHSRIGFVGTRLATSSIDNRFLGYFKSLMEHGVSLREDWIINDRDRESGIVDKEKYFQLPEEMPTSFFCNCDFSASLLICKLEEAGWKVPQDISVVGFDNYVSDQFAGIGITTYGIDTREMAKKAVQILLEKMESPSSQELPGIYMMAGRFILRGSAVHIGDPVPFV